MSTLFYQIPSYIVFVPNLTMSGEKSTLSDAALRVLDACVTAYRRAGRTVSAKEVGLEIGITSQAVLKQVAFLLVAGKVESTGVHYGLRPLIDSKGQPVELPEVAHLPILGTVAAGHPIDVVDSDPETLAIPAEWVAGECYVLRISGESMIGDGIRDGDYVVVRATETVIPNAIHVCWLPHDGATIKRVESKSDVTQLVASNRDFEPIVAPFGTIVQGRVIWVLRNLAPKKRRRRT